MPEVLDLRELGDDGDDGDDLLAAEPQPDVSVDADHGATGDDEDGGGLEEVGPWRRRTGVAVVVLLAIGAVGMLLGRPSNNPALSPPNAAAPAPGPEQVARAGLDAWARFASGEDIAALDGTFDPAGPQFARLQAEAADVARGWHGGEPYAFTGTVKGTGVGANGDEQLVDIDVLVTRPGEADRRYSWQFVLRRRGADAPWLVWTVREGTAPAAQQSPGGSS